MILVIVTNAALKTANADDDGINHTYMHARHSMVDSLYDYRTFMQADGSAPIGSLPPSVAASARVCIVGGGLSGICAAYELLRCGIKAVIFESEDMLGGRMKTLPFAPDAATASCATPPVAEMGAMRFSPMMATFDMYCSRLGIEWGSDFPNPLKVPTLLAFPGFKQFIEPGGSEELDVRMRRMDAEWGVVKSKILGSLLTARDAGDLASTRSLWQVELDPTDRSSLPLSRPTHASSVSSVPPVSSTFRSFVAGRDGSVGRIHLRTCSARAAARLGR
jgi:hypothetical protein